MTQTTLWSLLPTRLKKGTMLVWGNDTSLNSFEELFPKMKAEAERGHPNTSISTVGGDTASEQEEEDNTVVLEVKETDLKPTNSPSGPVPPTPPKLLQQLRESLSLLELDFQAAHFGQAS